MMERFKWKKFKHEVFPGNNPDYFLTPVELTEFISFKPQRIYYLHGMKHDECFSGAHCHLTGEEFIIILSGSMVIELDDGVSGLKDIEMQTNESIYIGPKVWHHFKKMKRNTVVLILSPEPYKADRSDYVQDYAEFQKILVVESFPIGKDPQVPAKK